MHQAVSLLAGSATRSGFTSVPPIRRIGECNSRTRLGRLLAPLLVYVSHRERPQPEGIG